MSDDEVYAMTASVLYRNRDHQGERRWTPSPAEVQMPNRNGFVPA